MNTRHAVLLTAALVSSGCIPHLSKKHEDFDALMAEYRKASALASVHHDSLVQAQVRTISVTRGTPDTAALVTIDVKQAPLAAVVQRIVDAAGIPVVYRRVALRGRATARFTNMPLMSALNELIGSYGYRASWANNVLAIEYGAAPGTGDPTEIITVQVPINYIQGDRVDEVLRSLLPTDRVRFAYQRATSNVTLIGKRQDIQESVGLLRQADQEAPHVFIEALVVEFDRAALERYGIDLTELSIGNFSEIAVLLGELEDFAVSGKRTYGADNPKSYRAFIDALASNNDARILARPYVTTRSGEDAIIDISTDQTLVIQGVQNGQAVASTRDVSAGVSLRITPWVLPADEVRVGIDVTESAFLPTTTSAAAIRDKNHATTVMQVPSGKTIVIGGLAYERRTNANAGAPFLKRIPLINLLFSNQQHTVRQQEVVVFITPHIWEPNIDPPMKLPGAFGVKDQDKKLRQ
ncbi:MAG TPA: type II and III secretion system protein [Longimicrobiales bacterium]|nr:type II and III secretion system protein [Longimicrobiales bacterium]